MSKQINITVNKCIECPYSDNDKLGAFCRKSDKLIFVNMAKWKPGIKLSQLPIPKWCELENNVQLHRNNRQENV